MSFNTYKIMVYKHRCPETKQGFEFVAKVEGDTYTAMKELYDTLCEVPTYCRVIMREINMIKEEKVLVRKG